jgi:hypothetical protein
MGEREMPRGHPGLKVPGCDPQAGTPEVPKRTELRVRTGDACVAQFVVAPAQRS